MPDPDHDTEPERRTNPRYDNWPVGQFDAWTNRPVERETPGDEGSTREQVAEEYEREHDGLTWVGVAGAGSQGGVPFVYDAAESAVYEGRIEDDDARVVLRHEDRHDLESEESLGERIEEIGDEHGWHWLSSFAREYLEDDDHEDLVNEPRLNLRDTEFQERAIPASSSADMSFHGRHVLEDSTGRVHQLERRFNVTDRGADDVAVDVEEYYHVAVAPREDESAGDSEPVDKREYSMDRNVHADTPNREAAVKEDLQEWHEAHVGPPDEV